MSRVDIHLASSAGISGTRFAPDKLPDVSVRRWPSCVCIRDSSVVFP